MDLTGVRELLELGWPAIVLIGLVIMWRAYTLRTIQTIENLEAERDRIRAVLEAERDHWREQYRTTFQIVIDRAKLSDQVFERERLQLPRARQIKRDMVEDEETIILDRDT